MKIIFISALIVTLEAVVPVWYNGTLRCGVSKYPDAGRQDEFSSSMEDTFGIIGGNISRPHEFPWMAGLVHSSYLKFIICGAAIISQRWVLTAAHCIDRSNNTWINNRRVVVGEHNVSEDDTTNTYRKYHKITHYFIAPGFRANNTTGGSDMALLRLETNISISQNVRPICAPDTEQLYVYWQSVVAGWGRIENGSKPSVIRYARLNISTNEECDERINRKKPFSANLMCTTDNEGDRVRGVCYGDSGGPLVVQDSNKTFSVVGIVSRSIKGCTGGYPDVYTRVSRFANWITNTIKNNSSI